MFLQSEARSVYSQPLFICASNGYVPAEVRVNNLALTTEKILSTGKYFFPIFQA